MRISDWSSDVCSSDLAARRFADQAERRIGQHIASLRPFVAEHAVVEQRITAPIMYSQERRRAGEGRKRRPRLRKPDMRRETGAGAARIDPPFGGAHRPPKPQAGKAAAPRPTPSLPTPTFPPLQ